MNILRRSVFLTAFALLGWSAFHWAEAGGKYAFRTMHYAVETTVSQDLAADIGEHMEILYAGYSKIFSGKPRIAGPSEVIIYKDQQEYEDNGGMRNSAGAFQPGKNDIKAFAAPSLRQTLAHEGFHQFYAKFLGTNGGVQWINEGLAEFFRCSLIDGAEVKPGLITKQDADRFKEMAAKDELIAPKELLTMDNATWNKNLETNLKKAYGQYMESRFLVYFLRFADKEKYVNYLNKYIKAVQLGKSGGDAVAMGFGAKFPEVAKEFTQWVENDLKPCAPEACSANLFHLAQLLYQFQKSGGKVENLEALKARMKDQRGVKWSVIPITMDVEHPYGPKDMDVAEKWFVCPKCGKGYELLNDPDAPEEGLPMIVCYAHHKKLAVCASFEKMKVFSNEGERVWPVVRNRQVQALKKEAGKAKKTGKD